MGTPFVVTPGDDLPAAIATHGSVLLGSGTHRGPLVLKADARIAAEDEKETRIDGGGRGSVVRIATDDLEVELIGVTLTGGHAEAGGGLRLEGYSTVTLQDCVVSGNATTAAGVGGGIWASRGELHLEGCRLGGNRARSGAALVVTGVAEVTVKGGEIAGEILLLEGATLTLSGVEVKGKVKVRGTSSRAPTLKVTGDRPEIENHPEFPGTIE